MSQPRSKRPTKAKQQVLALALTWDGACWPTKSLPTKARAFLAGRGAQILTPKANELPQLFVNDLIWEIRICWVPWLKGGQEVLSPPFPALENRRIGFQAIRTIQLSDICGVVYQRTGFKNHLKRL